MSRIFETIGALYVGAVAGLSLLVLAAVWHDRRRRRSDAAALTTLREQLDNYGAQR